MKKRADRIYGEWAISDGPHVGLEMLSAGHIHGTRLQSGADGKPARIDIQWSDASGARYQLELKFVEAMALLSMLKSHQLDSGLPFPDDPRPPSAR